MPAPPRLRFRLLGPVEFHDGTQWLGIGSAKQRALLAMLLLKVNQAVSLEQLMSELWDDNPPVSASGLVAGYAYRLRRALDDRGGRILTTRSPGYRLVVSGETIDIGECERLLRRAHADVAAGLPASGIERFDEALALWRGLPLADVRPTPMIMAEIARLEETRISALEARIGAELQLGRHTMLLPELKVLVSQHPLRERLHAHLMTALYQDGQQAVALGAYRDLRKLLVDELGIEPSQLLQTLEQRILRNDPSLRAPEPGIRLAATPRPQPSFPADPAVLRGRDEHLEQLVTAVRGGRIGVVQGLSGAGKTALAVHAAHRLAADYPDGLVFVPMGGVQEPPGYARVAQAVTQALGSAPPPGEDPPADLSTILAGRRMLIVLDDVAAPAEVQRLEPLPPGIGMIITARSGVTGLDRVTRVHVGALAPADALEVIRFYLGTERVDADPAAAWTLVQRCDALPLAVRVASARLASRPNWPIAAYVARLADPAVRLDALVCESMSVRECLADAVRQLTGCGDGEALRALRQLAWLNRSPVTVADLAALLDRSPAAAERYAERLVDCGLAEALPDGRYHVLELVRVYARELDRDAARKASPSSDRGAAADPADARRVVKPLRSPRSR
ncbi:hypothetical protein Areg01_72520 [Actinoplanes regularis]|nr:hypothetical protein Areg01_72520 [Actinoplanes regularis]